MSFTQHQSSCKTTLLSSESCWASHKFGQIAGLSKEQVTQVEFMEGGLMGNQIIAEVLDWEVLWGMLCVECM